MRVLLTGGSGQLGRELLLTAPFEARIAAPDRQRLDLERPETIATTVAEVRPDLVVNAAAYTAVDRAEEEKERAQVVNAAGAGLLAAAARRTGSRLIHLSTDFVFSGSKSRPYRPDDPPAPLGAYGESKLAGEVAVREESHGEALIVRTSWLYSRHGKNFVKTMLRLLGERRDVPVVADQVGSPTWARDLAEVIWRLAGRKGLSGILHCADAGVASWYDLAVAVREESAARGLVREPGLVRPIPTEAYPTAAPRPAYSVLDCRATWEATDLEPRHWRGALRGMLDEMAGADAS